MRKRKVVGQTETEDMSPLDVEKFWACIVDAGSIRMLLWLTTLCLV
jgi:hypothetical protein